MLILASASPRRRELLTQAGFSFQVQSIPIDETRHAGEDSIALVQRLAHEKADAVFRHRQRANDPQMDALQVLGADTVVVCDSEILGKPKDDADAARMLRLLSGRTHQVVTGVCVLSRANAQVASEATQVTMNTISDEEIAAYIATGEPKDKAGAYAIQGRASRWIPRISGCYFNVVGLPIALVSSMVESTR